MITAKIAIDEKTSKDVEAMIGVWLSVALLEAIAADLLSVA